MILLVGLAGCAGIETGSASARDPASAATEAPPEPWQARRLLQEARAFWVQDRLEAAVRATGRGLAFDETNADLHRLRAHLLQELGRVAEAQRHRARADELEPPPPPLPAGPHALDAPGLDVVLLSPPELGPGDRDRVPPLWPRGDVARTLRGRIALRLPSARVRHADPSDVDEATELLAGNMAQRVLALRVDRSLFATTKKDGSFGLAWLAWGASARAATWPARAGSQRVLVDALMTPEDPRLEAIARALEAVLADPQVEALLGLRTRGASQRPWDSASLGTVFPGIGDHSALAARRGRTLRARGELEAARDQFAEAVRILPSDPGAHELLDDTEAALAIARQLARAEVGLVELAPQLSAQEQAQLEAQLRDAREQRGRLAASLEILAETRVAPSPSSLDALSPGAEDAPTPPEMSAALCGVAPFAGSVRTLYSAGGPRDTRPLARFYFRAGAEPSQHSLCLRSDDRDEDGRMESWTGYRDGLRSDAWDDRSGDGQDWDRHIEYDPSGSDLAIVTFRAKGGGEPIRKLIYQEGRPQQEWRDRSGDGRFDTFDHFDPRADREGELMMRAEDRDADGEIDVLSHYEEGRLIRREWTNRQAPD